MCHRGCRYEWSCGEMCGECSLDDGTEMPYDAECRIEELELECNRLRSDNEELRGIVGRQRSWRRESRLDIRVVGIDGATRPSIRVTDLRREAILPSELRGRKCGWMTLDEAIKHAEERASNGTCGDECRLEHAQLAEWLKELRDMRDAADTIGQLRNTCQDLQSENEKLKQLVWDMVDYGEGAGTNVMSWFADRMREAGIEVDE